MSTVFRSLRCLNVRRSIRSRPIQIPLSSLPTRLCRPITVQVPGPNSSSDHNGAVDFDVGNTSISTSPASSSQHPFAEQNPSSTSSDPSSSKSVITTLPSPPEKVFSTPPPHMQHPFDTHAFVSYLEKADLNPVTSRTMMEAVRLLIVRRGEKTREDMVGKEDMENVSTHLMIRQNQCPLMTE